MAEKTSYADLPTDIQIYILKIVEGPRLNKYEFTTLYRLSNIFRTKNYNYRYNDYITYLFFFTFLKYCLLKNKLYFIEYDLKEHKNFIFKVNTSNSDKLGTLNKLHISSDLMSNEAYSKKYDDSNNVFFDPPAIIFDTKLMSRASDSVRIDLDTIRENTYITNHYNVVIDISLIKNNDNYTLIPNNEPIPIPNYDGVTNFNNILTRYYHEYLNLLEQIDPENKIKILKHITEMDEINNVNNRRPQIPGSINVNKDIMWATYVQGGNNIYYINSNNNIAYINYSNKKINFYQTENKIYIIIDKKKIYITKKIFGYNKELNKYFIKL